MINSTDYHSNLTDTKQQVPGLYLIILSSLISLSYLALIFNSFILAALVKLTDGFRGPSINAQLIAITINDILASLGFLIITGLQNISLFRSNRHLCASLCIQFYVNQTSYVMILGVIGVQRLIRVLTMKKVHVDITGRSGVVSVTAVPVTWLIVCLLYTGLYIALADRDTRITECTPSAVFEENSNQFHIITALANLSSLFMVNCIYVAIFIILKRQLPLQSIFELKCCCLADKPGQNESESRNSIARPEQNLSHGKKTIETKAGTLAANRGGKTRSNSAPEHTANIQTETTLRRTQSVRISVISVGPLPNPSTEPSAFAADIKQTLPAADSTAVSTPSISPKAERTEDLPTSSGTLTAAEGQRPTQLNKTLTSVARIRQKQNIRALVTVTLLLVVANLAIVPNVVLRISRTVGSVQVTFGFAFTLNIWMSIVNALINPFVYCLRLRQAKEAVKQLMNALLRRRPQTAR